ncbi:glycine-rich RNA-binding protein 3, mitochondrial isoform X2 [Pararge aegeria]|nr:glycine-rich RNA-binding protein 3, mitochondrial isoform X2 [Pararge aegeria]XP_039749312.1 glycine-rich RNA-binding protein 3, mitochondrial isoform X2 [Pararge aegeria]XP_039749313.1 glycine-rich RNA-binding protein 3, mitochondrial isoform X2 [Pararge aegeria]
MTYYYYQFLISLLVTVATYAAPENLIEQKKATLVPKQVEANNDLKTASSSYSHQYSNWGGNNPGGYGFAITGVGTIDDRRDFDPSYNTLGGYDSSIKNTGYGSSGYGGSGYGITGYGGNLGSGGYGGYRQSGYGASGPSPIGYDTSGFGPSGLDHTSGYISNTGYGGGNGGYGGYGGFGGNGGLTSYYGYDNPQYQGAGHLGYGYYNKKPGYGNIYSNGITPSLVTGYRGYTRR